MKLTLLSSCAVATLAFTSAGPLSAGGQDHFKQFDTNADNSVSQEEWTTNLVKSDAFKSWDTNADAGLDQSEFTTGTSTTFKVDMDAGKFDQTRYGDLAAWDVNKDGKVDQSEFSTGMYKFYDTDTGSAGLTSDEFGGTSKMLGTAGTSG